MENKLSLTRFYLSNIIFYTCLLTFPLSAAIKPLNTSRIDSVDQWLGIVQTESKKQGKEKNQEEEWLQAAQTGELQTAQQLKQQDYNINATDEDGNNALHLACLYSGSVAMVTWLLDECKIGIETKGKYQKTPFLFAAQKGQVEIAKLLRGRSANIHAKDAYENNALHWACLFSGSVAMVKWLLDECKLGLEAKGQYQRTPFLCTAEKGQFAIANLLKKRGASLKAKDKDGNNALHWACLYSGSVAMVTWLLDVCKIDVGTKGHYKKTSFLCAVQKGRLSIAKLLRKRGANIHAKSDNGDSALHYACWYSGSVAMVTWLLNECKIDLETKGQYQKTPFLCAVEKGHLSIAKLLRKRGANINPKSESGNNALHYACWHSGSVAMVTWLLDECKIDIETKGKYQKTPFLCAVQKGHLEIAKLLKKRGANINTQDSYGNNVLHYACTSLDSAAMVTWLLNECKIEIETKGYYQNTPFLSAANKGQLEIAKLLKKRGANIHVKNANGNNALHFACLWSESVPMVTWLLDTCKLDLETKGCYQKTPFLCAVEKGQLAIAKLLKDRGANIYAKNENKNNALHLTCCHSGSEEMVTWLLDVCKIGLETKGQNQITPFLSAVKEGHLGIAKLLKDRGANIHAKDFWGNNALNLADSGTEEMRNWLSNVCNIKKATWLSWLTG